MKYLILLMCLILVSGCSDIFLERAYTGFSETNGKFVCINTCTKQAATWDCYKIGKKIEVPELQGSYYK